MELTTENKPAPPVEITEDIQVSLNRLGRDLETHAESGIRIGKELLHLKEITPHGKFGDLVEWAYGLKKDTRTNYMNVALKFGESSTRVEFSNRVLIELSRPSVPESAREEAETKDSMTVKESKELAQKHKDFQSEIDRLKEENTRLKSDGSPVEPNLDNLIPEVKSMLDEKRIMPAMARYISIMSAAGSEMFKEMTAVIKNLKDKGEMPGLI